MSNLNKLIGLRIQAVRGNKSRKNQVNNITAAYICFDDKKTILHLNEQDYCTYHDCSQFARELHVEENESLWSRLMDENSIHYADASQDW